MDEAHQGPVLFWMHVATLLIPEPACYRYARDQRQLCRSRGP